MKIEEFVNKCRVNGRYSFTTSEAEKALELPKIQVLNALYRFKEKKILVSPAQGFYLIVPPEYQAYGCLPAEMFIPDLMRSLQQPYYVGFLSAAQFYGAAHQKPQRFQVVTLKNRRPIHCGRINVVFIANKGIEQMPIKQFNTAAGTIAVATPAVISLDLVSSPQHGAGINNVATVLKELSESINEKELIELANIHSELSWIQRLGYLFEFLDVSSLANTLAKIIEKKNVHWVKLVSNAPYKNIIRNKKWKIIVNTEVETDL